jgi:hypothetical protein
MGQLLFCFWSFLRKLHPCYWIGFETTERATTAAEARQDVERQRRRRVAGSCQEDSDRRPNPPSPNLFIYCKVKNWRKDRKRILLFFTYSDLISDLELENLTEGEQSDRYAMDYLLEEILRSHFLTFSFV